MESLDKIGDNLNPEVHFDQKTGSLSIRGQSIPLNVDAFFVEVIGWLEQYQEHPHNPTNLEIDLKYLNGQSIRTLLAILTKMKKINDGGSAVNVNWTIPDGLMTCSIYERNFWAISIFIIKSSRIKHKVFRIQTCRFVQLSIFAA